MHAGIFFGSRHQTNCQPRVHHLTPAMLILRKYFGNYFSVQSFRVTCTRITSQSVVGLKNKLTELKVKTNNEREIISKASEMFLKLGFKASHG
jgi:hypothetical protein